MVCKRRVGDDLPVNAYALPPPLDGVPVRGDLLLIKMDEAAEPQDFTLIEWRAVVEAAR